MAHQITDSSHLKNDVEIKIVPKLFLGRTKVILLCFSEIPHLLWM